MNQLVFIQNDRAVTDSLVVAETFGKRHADVMRDIRNLECSEEFNQRNFAQVTYNDDSNRQYPKYIISQDGFSFLVMGYTGKEAAQFKEMYINEFNQMRQLIEDLDKPSYMFDDRVLRATKWIEEEKERQALAEQVRLQAPKVAMADMVIAAGNTQPVGTVAKTVGMGRNKLFKFLREKEIFMKNSTIPYQRFIDAGYFTVKEVPTKRGDDLIVNEAVTRVTAKGLEYISKLVRDYPPA